MYNFEKDVIEWNKERGFIEKGFNKELELSFILSEILEMINSNKIELLICYGLEKYIEKLDYEGKIDERDQHKEMLRSLYNTTNHDEFALWIAKNFMKNIEKEEFIDMLTDIDVFSIGARAKMGLDEKDINNIRKIVMDINHQKPIGKINSFGKQNKPKDLPKAEVEIKKYLEKKDDNS